MFVSLVIPSPTTMFDFLKLRGCICMFNCGRVASLLISVCSMLTSCFGNSSQSDTWTKSGSEKQRLISISGKWSSNRKPTSATSWPSYASHCGEAWADSPAQGWGDSGCVLGKNVRMRMSTHLFKLLIKPCQFAADQAIKACQPSPRL